MRRVLPVLLAALLLPAPALAQTQTPEDAPNEAEIRAARNYQRCMALPRTEPTEAFEFAIGWQDEAGGAPARHCAAVALFLLDQFPEAATRLEALAQDMAGQEPDLVAGVLAQAGQAWYRAGEHGKAYAVQTSALELLPGDPSVLVDRGLTLADSGRLDEAEADFTAALLAAPGSADALTFRASARRQLDRLEQALADADAALRSEPGHPEALLERGNIRRLLQDVDGARADWVAAVQRGGATPAAEAAQKNLQALELGIEGQEAADEAPAEPATADPPE